MGESMKHVISKTNFILSIVHVGMVNAIIHSLAIISTLMNVKACIISFQLEYLPATILVSIAELLIPGL